MKQKNCGVLINIPSYPTAKHDNEGLRDDIESMSSIMNFVPEVDHFVAEET